VTIPETNFSPDFNVTRASHVVLTVRDLGRSRDFYTEVIGLVVTHESPSEIYLRGLEESCHHSLILRRTDGGPVCQRIGFRVFRDEDLDKAKAYFDRMGIACEWVERDFQQRTLHVTDASGILLELCYGMPAQPRLHDKPWLHRGAAALRYDHVQCLVPDVARAGRFYTDIGFRVSDYFVDKETDTEPQGLFLFRKNNPHDIVFLMRQGPQLHHFAFIVADVQSLFRALDTAGGIGFAGALERGPGRHGQGHAFYVYFRDPDGHRVEILPPPIQIIDFEDGPVRWHSAIRFTWDLPPPRKWLNESTRFANVTLTAPKIEPNLFSLEDFLARG
jgi:catechol 2,3-dioxygenase